MTTLLLLPGLICDRTVWDPVLAHWTPPVPHAFGDFTTQASLTAMAADTLAAHPGPLWVAGHSMGARVAMEMARLAPGRVARLALLDTGIHPRREAEMPKRRAMIALAHQAGMAALAVAWLPPMVHPDRLTDPALMGPLTAMVLRMDPALHERQITALVNRPDAGATIGAFTGPLALIVGREDQWSPVGQHQDIARLCPQAVLTVIEDAGHFAPAERPDPVARALAAWAA